jgi:hypothetical protein
MFPGQQAIRLRAGTRHSGVLGRHRLAAIARMANSIVGSSGR